MLILIILISLVISWPLWNIIHESSHLLMARLHWKFKSWGMKPYPHILNFKDGTKQFYFARCWFYVADGESLFSTNKERNRIDLAPRISNLCAIMFTYIYCLFISNKYLLTIILLFCFCGIIDLFVGSLGIGKNSDLKKVSTRMEISLWWFRIPGIIISILTTIIIILKFVEIL